MTVFELKADWKGRNPAFTAQDFSLANLLISIDQRTVSYFESETEEASDTLRLPLIYLAEWIAENWWALLWEPRKAEDSGPDDSDFLSRHSFLAAQRGFYLPDVSIVSQGAQISLSAKSRDVPYTDIRFRRSAYKLIDREPVEAELARFVNEVCEHLQEGEVVESYLQDCWNSVRETPSDAQKYCSLIGALGLSPYADNPKIDAIIDELEERIGYALTLDLCLVSKPSDLESASRTALMAIGQAHNSEVIQLDKLGSVKAPSDNLSLPGWRRGVFAAQQLRSTLNIADDDPRGADRVFERLKIDPSRRAHIGDNDFQAEGAEIVGAAFRHEGHDAQLSFLQRHEPQRRFSAARGLFSAWASEKPAMHLLTQAVTRYQQANRAFAAELCAQKVCCRPHDPL